MNKKKSIKAALAFFSTVIIALSLSACSSSESKAADYNDGTYSGRSSNYDEDESGNGAGYGEVTIKLENNRITECSFVMYNLDGTVKDETYGSELSRENRLKAQKAVQAGSKYAAAVIGKSNADDVDTISGATISCKEFKEAVNDALKKAEKA